MQTKLGVQHPHRTISVVARRTPEHAFDKCSAASERVRKEMAIGQIDREASYRRAIEVFAGAAEDPRCAATSRWPDGPGFSLGMPPHDTVGEAAVLAPEHDVAPRLLEMTPDASHKRSWCCRRRVVPRCVPCGSTFTRWQTGVVGWLCRSRCFVKSQTTGRCRWFRRSLVGRERCRRAVLS